jgi:hypothetical protein
VKDAFAALHGCTPGNQRRRVVTTPLLAAALSVGTAEAAVAERPPLSYWLGVDNHACTSGETVGIALRANGLKFSKDVDWIASDFRGANTKTIRVNKGGAVQEALIPDTGASALGAPFPQVGTESPSEQRFEYLVNFDLLGCLGMHGIDHLSGTWSVTGSGPTLRFETGVQKAVSGDALKISLSGQSGRNYRTGTEERWGYLQINVAHVTVTDLRGVPQERDLTLQGSFFVTLVPSDASLLPKHSNDEEQ